jgi:hypothetical protein
MVVDDVVFNGNYGQASTGIKLTDINSSGTVVRNCLLKRLAFGIYAVDTAARITRNRFEHITENGLFITLPGGEAVGATPVLGSAAEIGKTGLNQFRNFDGNSLFMLNTNDGADTVAQYNDWGAYVQGDLAGKISGRVVYEPWLGSDAAIGKLLVAVLDQTTDALVPASANPVVTIEVASPSIARDPATGLFVVSGLTAGDWTVSATAGSYGADSRLVTVSDTEVNSISLYLTPSGVTANPMDINSTGGVDATDVQLVINAALGLDVGGLDADVDNSGGADATDVQLVINAALGIE